MHPSFIRLTCNLVLNRVCLYTTMCTGALKNVVSCYINRGSSVVGCFLDASKAFDLVINHGMLFQKLLDRGLPMPVVRFL